MIFFIFFLSLSKNKIFALYKNLSYYARTIFVKFIILCSIYRITLKISVFSYRTPIDFVLVAKTFFHR